MDETVAALLCANTMACVSKLMAPSSDFMSGALQDKRDDSTVAVGERGPSSALATLDQAEALKSPVALNGTPTSDMEDLTEVLPLLVRESGRSMTS